MSRIEQAVRGWIRSGCGNPVVAVVENWSPVKNFPGYIPALHARHVVVVKYAAARCDEHLYYGEFDSYKAAERSARAVNGWISRYDKKYAGTAA
jgi:hypothetical protein